MQVVSVALPSSFSAPLSLLGLDTSGPITFGLSAGQATTDTYSLYGTLDGAATNAGNAQLLGQFNGASPWDAHTLTLRDNGGSIIVVLPSGQQGGAIIGYFGTDWLYLLAATL